MVGPREGPDTAPASSASRTSPRPCDPVWTSENINTAPEYSPRWPSSSRRMACDARRLGMPDAVTARAPWELLQRGDRQRLVAPAHPNVDGANLRRRDA